MKLRTKGRRPLINFVKTTIETIVELLDKDPWTSLIDNMASYTGVAFNYKEFIEDLKAVQQNPEQFKILQKEVESELQKKTDNERVRIIFRRVWASMVYTSGNMVLMAEELRELDEQPKIKQG